MMKALLACFCFGVVACSGGSDPVEDMAREHAEDAPVASEGSASAPSMDVRTESVAYASVEGAEVEGYLAEPADAGSAPLPGIVVIHEWWGLNDNIRSMTERLAGEGYRALAVDLYGGRTAETPDAAAGLMRASMDRTEALGDNLAQAVSFLERDGNEVGTIGWCFGGGWSLQTALAHPERVDATVIYYGRLVTDEAELEKLSMPILGIFGSEDEGISLDSVRAFESALASLGKNASIHVYEGADHAFANPSGRAYQAEPAEDAWRKTIAFFDEHLRS